MVLSTLGRTRPDIGGHIRAANRRTECLLQLAFNRDPPVENSTPGAAMKLHTSVPAMPHRAPIPQLFVAAYLRGRATSMTIGPRNVNKKAIDVPHHVGKIREQLMMYALSALRSRLHDVVFQT